MTLTLAQIPETLSILLISDDEWQQTPDAVRRALERLWAENQRLREQLGQTSRNTSRPPSTDPPTVPPQEKPATGRKAGGQPGHASSNRPLLPPEQVTKFVPLRPARCRHCGTAFSPAAEDASPLVRQVFEIPPIAREVTEYQQHTLLCSQCGQRTTAELPHGVPSGAYGPRLTAIAATLTGCYHLSKRAVSDIFATFFAVPISEGSVVRVEATMSAALAHPYAEALLAARAADRKWVDETGWRQQRDPDPGAPPTDKLAKAWLWAIVTRAATVFCIRRSRGRQVVTELLGEQPQGIFHTDRHSAYHRLLLACRQLCWAHLRRDFQKLVDRGGIAATVGAALVAETQQLFHLWHRIRDGTLTRAEFIRQMGSVQAEVRARLQHGAITADPRTATFCRILQRLDAALWTFVTHEGVEPTNNRAERAIRPAVLWRKLCFGTQTSAGSRAVERILTAVATCRQQQRNVLEYLTAVASAAYQGQPVPSLINSTGIIIDGLEGEIP